MNTTDTVEPVHLAGRRVVPDETFEVRSPYDQRLIATVGRAGATEAVKAVDAACDAMAVGMAPWQRAEILDRVSALIARDAEQFAQTISAEAGKPITAARIEAQRAVNTYRLSASEARKLAGQGVPMGATEAGAGRLGLTVRVPAGVVGAITPFNFPLNLVAHKTAPALAAGCAVVLKPASQTPLSALLLAETCAEAGLPEGWLSVLPGRAREIGDVLVEDDRVRVLTFTGSAEVGWGLRSRAPGKRVSLELGNSSPIIVCADADLDLAATKVARHAFFYAGQTCVSVQRVLVQRDVYDEFLARLAPRVAALRPGDPIDDSTDVGPLIDQANHRRVLDWIAEAVDAGARVVEGGDVRNNVVAATLLADVTPDMRVFCDEVFGPVCSAMPFDEFEQAIELANGTAYGLQAGVFTRSIDTAMRAVPALEFGGVLINEASEFRADQMPYGGVKASGNTKEGPAFAIREFTEERLVVIAAPGLQI